MTRFVLLCLAALLAGCAHHPVEYAQGCKLPRYSLEVPVPGTEAGSTYKTRVQSALFDPNRHAASLLFMSGGGQSGAFGAGILDQWNHEPGALPRFAVVTGVSTGALLGTFALTGETGKAIDGYSITREAELLRPLIKPGDTLGLVRKGAAGSLDPLRALLQRLLDDRTLGLVADADDQDRKFLVGAVDADTGDAIIYDLTEQAARWRDDPGQRQHHKDCYIEAILASASAPMAAAPVFIDGHMMIDGGARFGVFAHAAGEALKPAPEEAINVVPPVLAAYLIINGTLEIDRDCARGKARDGSCPASGPHRDWDIVSLGIRSADVLQNQIYRFSADYAAEATALPFRLARIEKAAALAFRFTPAEADLPGEVAERSCQDWLDRDNDPAKFGLPGKPPLQFHKRYMLCLIGWGREVERLGKWRVAAK